MSDKDRNIDSPHYGIYPFDPEAISIKLDVEQKAAVKKPEEDKQATEKLDEKAIYENPDGKRVVFDSEIPTNHKWFIGEFHTGSWGSDSSPFGGEPKDRVRVSMMGKKLRPETHNFIASVYGVISAVIDIEDREFIGKYGWWRTKDFSHANKKRGKV